MILLLVYYIDIAVKDINSDAEQDIHSDMKYHNIQ